MTLGGRRLAAAGLMRRANVRGFGSSSTPPVVLSELLALMAVGSRVAAWWEVGVSTETLTGQGFARIDNLGADAWHPVQATDTRRPAKDTTGGPLGDACMSFAGTDDRLTTNDITIASGKALFCIAVAKGVEAGVARQQGSMRTGTTEAAGDVVFNCIDAATANYIATCRSAGDAEENVTITTPAHSTGWYKRTIRYAESTPVASEINDVAISPALVLSDGFANAVETITFGATTTAAGKLKLWGIFEAVTAEEEALIHRYVYQRTGL